MKTNTMSLLNTYLPMVCFMAEDGTGSGDDASGGDGSDGASDEGQTAKPVLGEDGVEDTSDGGNDDAEVGEGEDDDLSDEEKEAAAKAAEVPDDGVYEFEIPEGVELSDEDQKAWSEGFKELGLTRGQAAALVKMQSEKVLHDVKAQTDAIEAQQTEHLEKAKADPEIGGDKWDESVKTANAALRVLRGGPKGDPDTKNPDGTSKGFKPESAIEKLILQSGNGNNPEVIRELGRIGAKMVDDKFDRGDTQKNVEKSTEEVWYGDTTPSKKKG